MFTVSKDSIRYKFGFGFGKKRITNPIKEHFLSPSITITELRKTEYRNYG